MTISAELKNKISIVDLKAHYENLKDEINSAVIEVLSSGHYVLGKNVTAFEKELADYLGCKYVVSCANGTDAIVLSLMALNVGSGDEVITVPNSFFATSEAIALVGAKPVFVDIKEDDFNIDPSKIEALITDKTKAIIPVHLYGNPCEINSVTDIAKKHNLYVIEDCAQAIGAKLNGKTVGLFGNTGTLSFFPTKNLGAFGDGGAVFTDDKNIPDLIRELRAHGSSKRYEHNYIGLNSRLDEIQAAILRIELKYLDKWILKRQEAAKYYDELLRDISDIVLPVFKSASRHVFHQYTIRVDKRDELNKKLNEKGIEVLIYYPVPIHLQKAFSYLGYKKGSFPITEKISTEVLSLPMYPEITKEIQEYVVSAIKGIIN